MVITADSDSANLGSIPRETYNYSKFEFLQTGSLQCLIFIHCLFIFVFSFSH